MSGLWTKSILSRNRLPAGELRADSRGRLFMVSASLLMRAIQLAESGQHYSCLTVEVALAAEGYPEAFGVFKDDGLRAGILAICQKHWRTNAEGDANDNHPFQEGEQANPPAQSASG